MDNTLFSAVSCDACRAARDQQQQGSRRPPLWGNQTSKRATREGWAKGIGRCWELLGGIRFEGLDSWNQRSARVLCTFWLRNVLNKPRYYSDSTWLNQVSPRSEKISSKISCFENVLHFCVGCFQHDIAVTCCDDNVTDSPEDHLWGKAS